MMMMIMVTMIGWLTEYVDCFGTLHISAVMLPNFRQQFMNAMIIYIYIYGNYAYKND